MLIASPAAFHDAALDDLLIEDAAVHEIDVVAWLLDEPVVSIEVQRGRRNRLGPDVMRDPLLVLLRTESDVLVDVEIQAWVDAVLSGAPVPGATAWDGFRATALTEAGVESLRLGRRVEVAPVPTPAFSQRSTSVILNE